MGSILYRSWQVIVGAVFLWAGFAKVNDPTTIAKAIQFLGVPQAGVALLLAALICFEVALGTMLVTFGADGKTLAVTLFALIAFSTVLIIFLMKPTAPDCGCLGTTIVTRSAKAGHFYGLLRNAILIVSGIALACVANVRAKAVV